MAQRDYVRRAQSTGARRKKTTSRNTQRRSSVSPAMVVIAAAVVVAFVSALYFITHRKAEEIEVIPGHKVTGNGLPPKPEERWRYIKELENRQPGVRTPTEPTAGGEVINSKQLTNEQRQLLEQMQADMRQQQPMQLSEVPWNEQAATAQRQKQIQAQQQSLNTQAQTRVSESTRTQPVQQPRVAQTQQPKTVAQPYQDLVQTPPHTQQTKPAAPVTTVTREPEPVKRAPEPQEKKDERRWMVQCGSFKGSEQAETVRAQLAFEGFASRITTNNGWNRVVIGPLKGKENADNTISRLKIAGHGNCIRLAFGG
ncbi:cell division protein FtsN [Klebsiella sp. BIGb0407]|uniref:cell division protein FtsN n=1 Tax=Klebsiella sp. BIGb0407 TaxID=2940603 RepID=UPI0021685471|nr:cell division protein FtsN [Klebsiella sp. BIGb0407]MCS3434184.1 cell division protein FtsN [Klebsiella sp. BIGb0407]